MRSTLTSPSTAKIHTEIDTLRGHVLGIKAASGSREESLETLFQLARHEDTRISSAAYTALRTITHEEGYFGARAAGMVSDISGPHSLGDPKSYR